MKRLYFLSACFLLFVSNLPAQDPAGWRYYYIPYYRNINALHIIDQNTFLVAGGNETNDKVRTIARTEDGGHTWQNVLDLIDSSWIRSMYFVNVTSGFAAGFEGLLLMTTDGGQSWTRINLAGNAATRGFNSIFFLDGQTGFIAGGNRTNDSIQTILKTTDGGNSWSIKRDIPGSWLKSIYFTDANNGYATGEGGVALKTTDGGDTWSQMTLPGSAASRVFNTIIFIDGNIGFMGGGNEANDSIQTILKTTDAGTSWNIIRDSIAPWISSIQFMNANDGFAAGDDGTVLVSNNGGDTWNDAGVPDSIDGHFTHHRVVYFQNVDFGIVAGTAGKVMVYHAPVPSVAVVQTDYATNVGHASVTFNGAVHANGNAYAVAFEYWTASGGVNTVAAQPDSVFGNTLTPVSAAVSGLTANTLYYFRTKAENSNGVSYGNIRQIVVGGNPIPNPDFEIWETLNPLVPETWISIGTISQVLSHDGSHAAGITGGSYEYGVVFLGVPNYGGIAGGVPFAARPDSLIGFFNYDVAAGDSALILLWFKKNGVFNSQQFYYLTGSSGGNFQRLSFPISYTNADVPDSVIIAVASTDPIFSPTLNGSSSVAVDNISFSGTTENIPNNDFEDWYTDTIMILTSWTDTSKPQSSGITQHVLQTTDSQHGSFAVQLRGNASEGGDPGYISTSVNGLPSFPVYQKHETFNFFMKFFPENNDTLDISVNMYKQGQNVGSTQVLIDSTISDYTAFIIPLSYQFETADPDSANISFRVSTVSPSTGNSLLYIDNMGFDGFYTGVEENNLTTQTELPWHIYPNPAQQDVVIKGINAKSEKVAFSILNINGAVMQQQNVALPAGIFEVTIDVENLPGGIYVVALQKNGAAQFSKLVIAK